MKSLKQELENSKGVLVLLSKNPYLDQVAAGLSLYLSLKDKYKTNIACPSPMLVEYNRLVGVNKIVTELGDKNLVIKFKDYKAQNIEKVTYDIEEDEFKLTIIPKAEVTSPTSENIIITAASINYDTVILVGGGNESHFPSLNSENLKSAKLIHIGKQDVASTSSKQMMDISRQAASVTEIMADVIKEFGEFNKDIATNLLAGLREGTRDFSHSYVNADTFKLASELMAAGGEQDVSQSKTNNGYQKPEYKKPAVSSASQAGKPEVNAFKKAFDEANESKEQDPSASSGQARPEEVPTESISPSDAPSSWLEPKIFKGTSRS